MKSENRSWLMAMTAVANAVLALQLLGAEPYSKSEALRDCCWMWGHETGQIDCTNNAWGLPAYREYYHQVQACNDFGVSNLCCVRWDMPNKEFLDSLAGLRRVTFPVSSIKGDAKSYAKLLDWTFNTARSMPNMTGVDFDDFFRAAKSPQPTAYTVDELKDIRRRAAALGRPFEMRVIAYDFLFHKLLYKTTGHSHARDDYDMELRPYFEQFDTIMLWVWESRNIKNLPVWLDGLKKVSCGKSVLQGIYLWDFGTDPRGEISAEDMKFQLDFALEKWKAHEIDGVVFLATSICNRDFEAVRMAREWVKANGECKRSSAK